jgi:hypothetical protein
MQKFLFLLLFCACTSVSAQQSSITVTRVPQQGPSFFVREADADLLTEFNAFKKKLFAYYPVSNKEAAGEYVLLYVEHISAYASEYQVSRSGSNDLPMHNDGQTLFYGENFKVMTVQLPTSVVRSKNYYYIRKSPNHRIDSLSARLNRNELEMASKAAGTFNSEWMLKMQLENDSIYRLISGAIQPEITELARFVQTNKIIAVPDSSMNCRMLYYREALSFEAPSKEHDLAPKAGSNIICKRGAETVMPFSDWMKTVKLEWHEEMTTWANGDYIMVELRSNQGTETSAWQRTRTYCFRMM